jgi:glucan phosphoethanolaminetransferase (alkaline phosphatase superfamily)
MFSAYEIVLSLGIEVTHMGSGMIGLAIGAVLTLVVAIFGVLLHRHPELFGEFTEKFNKESCIQSHYYCFLIAERIITAACLVMAFFNPLGAVIVGLLALQIVLVVWRKPYKGDRAWLRPFLNLLLSILIQMVFILSPMLSSNPSFARYAPFAVLAILAAVLAYNIYYFIQQFRSTESTNSTLAV